MILEEDLGEETITLGNIIRDATVIRKQLVYEQLERTGHLDTLGWGKRIYFYVMKGKKDTKTSARKRIASAVGAIPASVNPHRFFFVDRQSFDATGDDISNLTWLRGDGAVMQLPCWR